MKNNNLPLYVIGMPDDEFSKELIVSKFSSAIQRLQKSYDEIEEARVSIKLTRSGGNKKNYSVTILIKTPRKRFNFEESGWDLSNVSEQLCQRILDNLTKRSNKRTKKTIRKIDEKLF